MIILMLVFGIVGGLIGGSIFLLIKLYLNERKAKKDFNQEKIILRKGENINKSEVKNIDIPKINNVLPELPKESDYKTDFKKFNEANKELESLKKKYEKGKLTYPELKDKFTYYQNQDYYKRILKDHEKK